METSMLRIVLAAIALAAPSLAQEAPDGRALYMGACAGCHGEDAIGDGPAAELLAVPVPDLSRLAAGNGGEFPRLAVIHVIDGRTGIRAHGGPMPVFGTLLTGQPGLEDGPQGTPVFADRRILALVDYLESIQQ
jgi:mono/diheme cytochrome c family protein